MCCSKQCFHLRNSWKNKKRRRERAGWLEQNRALSLWHKNSFWSMEYNRARPRAPLGQAANNTHNAACLWLLESPAAVLVQLVLGCAREQTIMPNYRCQMLAQTTHYSLFTCLVDSMRCFSALPRHRCCSSVLYILSKLYRCSNQHADLQPRHAALFAIELFDAAMPVTPAVMWRCNSWWLRWSRYNNNTSHTSNKSHGGAS